MLRVSSAFQCSVQHVLNSFIFTVEHNSSIVDCLNSCTCRIYACLISSDTRSIMFSSFFPLLLHCLAGRTGLHFWLQQLVILLCTVYSAFFLLPPHQSPESEIWNPKLNHPTGSLTACGVASGLIFFPMPRLSVKANCFPYYVANRAIWAEFFHSRVHGNH